MIYVDTNKQTEGRTQYWRVYADTAEELRKALDAAGISHNFITHVGQDNEHALISTAHKNKMKGAVETDMKGIVRVIRAKRAARAASIIDVHTPPAPEDIPDMDEAYDPTRPKTGKLVIKGKPAQSYNHDEDDEADEEPGGEYPDEAAEE